MNRDDILRIIRENQEELKNLRVKSLALFGSYARNEQRPDSDVDLLVEFVHPVGYFGLFGLQEFLSTMLGRNVDISTFDAVRPEIKESVDRDLIYGIQ